MAKYELTLLFKKDEKEGLKIAEALLKGVGAKVEKKEDWKVKKLAYAIAKEPEAHFYYYELEVEPKGMDELHKKLAIEEKLLRSLIVKSN